MNHFLKCFAAGTTATFKHGTIGGGILLAISVIAIVIANVLFTGWIVQSFLLPIIKSLTTDESGIKLFLAISSVIIFFSNFAVYTWIRNVYRECRETNRSNASTWVGPEFPD